MSEMDEGRGCGHGEKGPEEERARSGDRLDRRIRDDVQDSVLGARAGVPETGNNETGGLGVRCQILFGYPHQNQFLSPNRKQKKNHTSKLHELALLLPVAPRTSSKKLTKVCGLKERR